VKHDRPFRMAIALGVCSRCGLLRAVMWWGAEGQRVVSCLPEEPLALETINSTHQAIIRAHTLQSEHANARGSEYALHGYIHTPTPLLERVTRSDRSSRRSCGRQV
jgi:hypothetical protein